MDVWTMGAGCRTFTVGTVCRSGTLRSPGFEPQMAYFDAATISKLSASTWMAAC